ncbi:hypothetical protein DERP_012483 [Dermatophagoides pteronyssinus]|uniref:Uncharacterized protein n=1 Tax=Dermatophagoides pteronyssinus TaxID=6956 RepID=A0ABQ8IX39_DERPT|nr:hypothetical protein DERP_012483 [Dermatophagoides pteronyssinus]
MEKCLRRNEFIPDPYGMGTVFLMTTISVTELLNNFAMLAFDLQCCYNNILTKQTTEQKTNTVSNSNDYSDHKKISHIKLTYRRSSSNGDG